MIADKKNSLPLGNPEKLQVKHDLHAKKDPGNDPAKLGHARAALDTNEALTPKVPLRLSFPKASHRRFTEENTNVQNS